MNREFIGIGILFLFLLISAAVNSSHAQSGYCHAMLYSEGPGGIVTFTNQTDSQIQNFAGVINGSADGSQTQFYKNEYCRILQIPDGSYYDSSSATDSKIIYILNNYFPLVSDPDGKLNDLNEEAAATQLAIWHFSNSVNANTIAQEPIKLRALTIISDALINAGSKFVPYTLDILPDIDPDYFIVKTTDCEGNGISVNDIELSLTQSSGKLSTNLVNTVNGFSPPVRVIDASTGLLTATGNCVIPPGIIFVSHNQQRPEMLIAKPAFGRKSISYDWGTLPVEISSFTCIINNSSVNLKWLTLSEVNNSGFNVQRRGPQNFSGTEIDWKEIGFVQGNGTTVISHTYSFEDQDIQPGKYSYRLKQTDYNGNFEYFNLDTDVEIYAPLNFVLDQNFPNPFNPNTVIKYQLPVNGFVSLKIYDIRGNEIKRLVNTDQNAGTYKIEFSGGSLSSGVYYYKIEAESFSKTMKMLLVK